MKLWNRRSKTGEEFIADGGSAMMAYARMQFDDVTQEERNAVFNALLSYCELDMSASPKTGPIKSGIFRLI